MKKREALNYLAESVASAWTSPFRGEIWEYARKLDLQKGYAVKGPFDISTARHLIEPLRALRDPRVRLVSIRKGVQTLGSLIADITVPFWIEHDPGDILWLFEDDPKAKLYAESRAMPLIRGVPEIARMLEGVDRHDKTKTSLRFKHMTLQFAGLNEGNVQSLSWRYVIIDEAWMARANGFIRQAIDRTKQYPDTKKILLIGQGGWEDEDADLVHKETDQRELHYRCPECDYAQTFALSRERPEELRKRSRPEAKYAGLQALGTAAEPPSAHEAAHVCFHCGLAIRDTPANRDALNKSYFFQATNASASPEKAGFWWPSEASMRVPLADLLDKYLKAKKFAEEQSYRLPLQEFYQKDRGLVWNDGVGIEWKTMVTEPYDVSEAWHKEAFRFLISDVQRDLGKFYAGVFAVALDGDARELARTQCASFEELAALQREWKVRDGRVFLDCGYQMTKVLRECVRHGHIASIRVGKKTRRLWVCWTGLKGSGQELFCHIHPRTQAKEFRIYGPRKFYDTNVGTAQRLPRSPWYEWSNLHCKDLLRARRDADRGAPKFLTLPDERPREDPWSYFAQMHSEFRKEDFANGRKRSIWLPLKKNNPPPNHEWDKGAMLMAVMAIVGIIGQPEPAEPGEPAEPEVKT